MHLLNANLKLQMPTEFNIPPRLERASNYIQQCTQCVDKNLFLVSVNHFVLFSLSSSFMHSQSQTHSFTRIALLLLSRLFYNNLYIVFILRFIQLKCSFFVLYTRAVQINLLAFVSQIEKKEKLFAFYFTDTNKPNSAAK